MDNTPHHLASDPEQLITQQKEKAAATPMTETQRQWFDQSFQEADRLAKQLPSLEESSYLSQNQQTLAEIGQKKKHPSTFTEEERKLVTIYQKLHKQKPNQAALKISLDNIVIRLGEVRIAPHLSEVKRAVGQATVRSLAQNSALASHKTTPSKGAGPASVKHPH